MFLSNDRESSNKIAGTNSRLLRQVTVPNNRMERTAAMRLDFDGDGLQTAEVAVASALQAAVIPPCS